ncbi:LOG family protein [Candidatus Woesebacteria bacterium]|nr:LOG family protein [Candidatus Woesebacteria bacterium]
MKTTISTPRQKQPCAINSVAIFGSADVDERHPLYREAFSIARFLAYQGKTVVDGGGPGTMDAATKGAESADGNTIAVTFYPKDMPEFEGRYFENNVDTEIKTANYIERMFGLMDVSDAVICMQGGTGTLSEWATAWLLAHLYYGNHKPLILYGSFWHEVMSVMNTHFFIGEKENTVYRIADNLEELHEALWLFEQEIAQRCQTTAKQGAAVSQVLKKPFSQSLTAALKGAYV